ncbi:MAG: hypothetical protein OET90_08545 [Desulfuromonadales bacterium]|nr:hypothetical protein [Desulfuromonadales bacterium]
MVVGFNHNFRYRGEVYHIQTEDSGLKSPNIVTLLYYGGTILASKKTSYADIAKVDNLEQVVEELMKEQHKGMLRSLKAGEFDEILARFHSGRALPAGGVDTSSPDAESAPVKPAVEPAAPTTAQPQQQPVAKVAAKAAAKPVAPTKPSSESAVEGSLDEVVLSYLMGEKK